MAEDNGTIIGEIQKKDTEKIQVARKEFKGFEYVDIRTMFLGEDGQWQFTKKGITLAPAKVKELIAVLQKIPEAAPF